MTGTLRNLWRQNDGQEIAEYAVNVGRDTRARCRHDSLAPSKSDHASTDEIVVNLAGARSARLLVANVVES